MSGSKHLLQFEMSDDVIRCSGKLSELLIQQQAQRLFKYELLKFISSCLASVCRASEKAVLVFSDFR